MSRSDERAKEKEGTTISLIIPHYSKKPPLTDGRFRVYLRRIV